MVRDTLQSGQKQTHHTDAQTRVCGCVWPTHSHTHRHPVTNSPTTKVKSASTASPGVPLFQLHPLWAGFNTTELCVRVWDSEGTQTSSCSYFLLYSHPLQLSEIGCMPPPTLIALPSITPRWQQTDTSSHSHSAFNITLLQSATTGSSSHISAVHFCLCLCHKLYFALLLRLCSCDAIGRLTVNAFHSSHRWEDFCERCSQTQMLAFWLFSTRLQNCITNADMQTV